MTVSIPTPCKQDWSSFQQTKLGGFCSSCNKEVIDFTTWKPEDIQAYLSKKHDGACGRLRVSQLGEYPSTANFRVASAIKWLAPSLVSASLIVVPTESDAQRKEPFVSYQVTTGVRQNSRDNETTPGVLWEINGKVTDYAGETMPGVNVTIKGTNFGTVTNAEGEYNLTVHQVKGPNILVFEFIGMITQEIPINGSEQINVILQVDQTAMSEVVIVGGICSYRWYSPRGWWYKIRGLFRRY